MAEKTPEDRLDRIEDKLDVRSARTGEDVERADQRSGEDLSAYDAEQRDDLGITQRLPLWRRVVYGVMLGLIAAMTAVGSILVILRFTDSVTISEQVDAGFADAIKRVDRNAEVTRVSSAEIQLELSQFHYFQNCVFLIATRHATERTPEQARAIILRCERESERLELGDTVRDALEKYHPSLLDAVGTKQSEVKKN